MQLLKIDINLFCRRDSSNETSRLAGWDSSDSDIRYIRGSLDLSRTFEEFGGATSFQKEVLMEKVDCKDHPLFMGTDTYYPPRGACFR